MVVAGRTTKLRGPRPIPSRLLIWHSQDGRRRDQIKLELAGLQEERTEGAGGLGPRAGRDQLSVDGRILEI